MDIDSALVMDEFLKGFGSLLVLLGIGGIVSLVLATAYIFIEYKPWKDSGGDWNDS